MKQAMGCSVRRLGGVCLRSEGVITKCRRCGSPGPLLERQRAAQPRRVRDGSLQAGESGTLTASVQDGSGPWTVSKNVSFPTTGENNATLQVQSFCLQVC